MRRRFWDFSLFVLLIVWVVRLGAESDPLAQIRLLTGQQQFAEALLQLDEFLSEHPSHLDAKLLRGVVLTRQGDIDGAIAAFELLSTDHPALPEPHNNLAVLHASRGDYESARMALLRAIELQPRYDTAHENLGDLYTKLATIQYTKALKLNPENARARGKNQVLIDTMGYRDEGTDQVSSATAAPLTQEPPIVTTPETAASVSPKACYVIGRMLEEDQATQISSWFDEHDYAAESTSRQEDVPIGYRVFIPPLESSAASDVQITRMRAEGVEDILRIRGGKLDNGIALGVYATEAAAARRVASLESKGYSAQIATYSRPALVWYVGVVTKPDDPATAEFATRFPDYRVRQVSCE